MLIFCEGTFVSKSLHLNENMANLLGIGYLDLKQANNKPICHVMTVKEVEPKFHMFVHYLPHREGC